jgi:hypothetical protein
VQAAREAVVASLFTVVPSPSVTSTLVMTLLMALIPVSIAKNC